MTTDVRYNDLVNTIDQQFPQFSTYLGDTRESIKDNVNVYFSFFSVYLNEHWTDEPLQAQVAHLLNQMHASADEATQVTLRDFLLDVCSSCKEHDKDISLLMNGLNSPLQDLLSNINSQWLVAACALHRGCC